MMIVNGGMVLYSSSSHRITSPPFHSPLPLHQALIDCSSALHSPTSSLSSSHPCFSPFFFFFSSPSPYHRRNDSITCLSSSFSCPAPSLSTSVDLWNSSFGDFPSKSQAIAVQTSDFPCFCPSAPQNPARRSGVHRRRGAISPSEPRSPLLLLLLLLIIIIIIITASSLHQITLLGPAVFDLLHEYSER